MTTILFCPATFNLAETTRMIEVARALDPSFRAVFLGYESDFAHLVRDAGFAYHAGAPAWTPQQRRQALRFDQGKTLRSPFTEPLVSARVALERRIIRRHGAAAVVIGTNLTSLISARAEGVPILYPVPLALTRPHVAQTRRLGLVQGKGRVARAMDTAATAAFRWVYNAAPVAPRAFARVARAHGAPPLRTIASLLEADVNLLTVLPAELDGYVLPDNYRRVGPIYAHLDQPLPPVVAELAAAPEPLVYLGLGSSADRRLALTAARQLGRLPVNVIAPIRHYLQSDDTVPANVHVTGLLPAHRLGGLVDAAVLHGGQGTVQTASAQGIPFVGLGLQPEQRWNVAAHERLGNAVGLSPGKVGSAAFPAAVHHVLSSAEVHSAAGRVRALYAAENGAAASARVIAEVVGNP